MNRIAPLVLLLHLLGTAAYANPTGSGLVLQPLHPCRVFDSRVELGPLPNGTATDVSVRGDALPDDQGGSGDCGVPAEAEAVVVDVHVVNPTTSGYLKISGTGGVTSPAGAYTRLVYNAMELATGEMTVSLCNTYLFPAEHAPCPGQEEGTYADFQIVNAATTGSSAHVVVDVVGYFVRQPITTAVAGEVINRSGTLPGPITLVLDSGLALVCATPFTDPAPCSDVEIGWNIRAAGHVQNLNGSIFIYAEGVVGIDQN